MGKMTYKKRKNMKKQSFKNRKNKKMKGGSTEQVPLETSETIRDDHTSSSESIEKPNVDTQSSVPENTSDKPVVDIESTNDNVTNLDITSEKDLPETDDGYKQFLEELRKTPDQTLREKVYLWSTIKEMYIYDHNTNKWENKREEVNEDTHVADEDNREV